MTTITQRGKYNRLPWTSRSFSSTAHCTNLMRPAHQPTQEHEVHHLLGRFHACKQSNEASRKSKPNALNSWQLHTTINPMCQTNWQLHPTVNPMCQTVSNSAPQSIMHQPDGNSTAQSTQCIKQLVPPQHSQQLSRCTKQLGAP